MILEENERRIRQIIRDCEDIQESGESTYSKEQAKVHAYNEIVEVIGWDRWTD